LALTGQAQKKRPWPVKTQKKRKIKKRRGGKGEPKGQAAKKIPKKTKATFLPKKVWRGNFLGGKRNWGQN